MEKVKKGVRLENISKIYQDPKTGKDFYAVHDANLDIAPGSFVTLLGPSGCGKTTTLRMIAGFESPDAGEIYLGGEPINELTPNKRDTAMVFQSYALLPHYNVFDNVAYGLKLRHLPKEEIREKVMRILDLVELTGMEGRMTNQLSGGQQQRVAIARALVNRPKVLLLDEPLGALDLKLRKEMQIELKRIQQALEITFIYVTHDQEEALTMSDRVVVMRDGNILQIGTPQDIYNEPCNAFVADFIGESNIIDGIMHKDFLVEFANDYFDCVDKGFEPKERVQVVVRPEDFKIVPADKGKISGIVESIIFKGVHYEIMVDAMGYKWKIHTTQYVEPGTLIGMDVAPMDIHIMKRTEE